MVVSNYPCHPASLASDLFVLLLFVQFVKLSCRFYSQTLIDHNFSYVSCCYLFIEFESKLNFSAKMIQTYKTIRIVRAFSFVNGCI